LNLNSAALRLMVEKGLTLEDVAEIVAANEARVDATANERQRRCRAKKKEANGHGVTVTRDTVSPNEYILTPSEPPTVISDEITPPSDPPTLVLEAFNLMAGEAGLPKARMTPERRKKLTSFTRRHKVEDITEAIWRIPQTPFLCGENDRGWKADFDFLLQPKSFNRILEGSYGG
jgi:hypothetical protein